MSDRIKRVLILGAGFMGSAITFPISDSGKSVALWGTWLDDNIIDRCKKGQKHPKLKKILNKDVDFFFSNDMRKALIDADIIVIAVSSEGFIPVFEKLLTQLEGNIPIVTLTKGFVNFKGKVLRISDYAEYKFREKFGIDKPFYWGSVGGPVKAVELSRYIPTATIIGSRYVSVLNIFKSFETGYYRVSTTNDTVGVEVSSALKNVYAIAISICDGVYHNSKDSPLKDQYHNFKSALFMQSIEEMAYACGLLGGRMETAYKLAGTGDLYVTVASGRNSFYGRRLGMGENAKLAYNEMLEEDKLVEGYNSLKLAKKLFNMYSIDFESQMPLFNTLYDIVFISKKYNGQLEDLMKKLHIK